MVFNRDTRTSHHRLCHPYGSSIFWCAAPINARTIPCCAHFASWRRFLLDYDAIAERRQRALGTTWQRGRTRLLMRRTAAGSTSPPWEWSCEWSTPSQYSTFSSSMPSDSSALRSREDSSFRYVSRIDSYMTCSLGTGMGEVQRMTRNLKYSQTSFKLGYPRLGHATLPHQYCASARRILWRCQESFTKGKKVNPPSSVGILCILVSLPQNFFGGGNDNDILAWHIYSFLVAHEFRRLFGHPALRSVGAHRVHAGPPYPWQGRQDYAARPRHEDTQDIQARPPLRRTSESYLYSETGVY